jgi:hypothetical protein
MKHLLLAATLSLTASAAFACETVTALPPEQKNEL